MPLQSPPPDLTDFPERPTARSLRTLYRIVRHRDEESGDLRGPWFFSCVPPGSNRFDLPHPEGTCYWSDRRYGAFLEVFRNVPLVDEADAKARRLWAADAPALKLGDLLAPEAAAVGVTAAVSTQPDYEKPQEWAAAIRALGFEGVVGTCSHDPTSTALNIGVFGEAGTVEDPAGWATTAGSVDGDSELVSELVAFGVRIAPTPYDVAISPPPA